ncbi:MAG: protein kinase [Myxococcales bacterium]|nr:MAG: protein kinase [Myxococcales bacterium]
MVACPTCGEDLAEGARFCAHCGAAVSAAALDDPLIGRVINGAYRVEEAIGVGGMGRVYRATQTNLGRTVAIKVIHQHLLGDEPSVARFYTEARAASRLNHPNSVGIIDFGRTDDGLLHLVMEYLHGKDLALLMQDEGPFSFPRICRILENVLAALAEAHELSVIHRDLKPENIIIQKSRRGGDFVKVVDFGLAKILEPSATSVTTPGLVCGTPDYMSPEQARGEEVDGRGDIYSVGVLLFELLSERLPFEDETPTKVALRHLTDPVPDPRVLAPHRNIPDELAEICMRALSKEREDRYATADEMAAAIRQAHDHLGDEHDSKGLKCPACSASVKSRMKFCAECGVRLGGAVSSVRPSISSRPPMSLPPVMDVRGRLIGRHAEIEQFDALRDEAKSRPIFVHFSGEIGMGKTRLLSEIADRASKKGDAVVASGPHASGALVPYSTIRSLIAGLVGVEESNLRKFLESNEVFEDGLSRAGLHELVQPNGLSGLEGRSRAGAVAYSLAAAMRWASLQTSTRRVIVLVDDLGRCDGLSQRTLAKLPQFIEDLSAMVVTTSDPAFRQLLTEGVVTIPLRGLVGDEASQLFSGSFNLGANSQPALLLRPEGMSPFYIEQIRALGVINSEDEASFPRLSDVIIQRLERLEITARKVLQAAAVLGERCTLEDLQSIVNDPDINLGLDTLQRSELLYVRDNEIQIAHPFIRDLVEASIPAAARMDLHAQALQVANARQAPLEVRAQHAYRGGEFMTAMVLLERMGTAALHRGSAETAIDAFRHGLELARRELLETGDDSLDKALVSFSRRLGEALELQNDYAGADGVLREAIDLAGPSSVERARMLNVLGRVGARRERRRDAMRLLGTALEIATNADDAEVAADAHLAISKVRLSEGDQIGAANALRRASEQILGRHSSKEAEIAVRLAETLIDIGDVEEGQKVLERAYQLAVDAESPALLAAVLGVTATVDELEGQIDTAARRYKEAAQQAAEAGDADAYFRWRRASSTLKKAVNE